MGLMDPYGISQTALPAALSTLSWSKPGCSLLDLENILEYVWLTTKKNRESISEFQVVENESKQLSALAASTLWQSARPTLPLHSYSCAQRPKQFGLLSCEQR